MFYSNEKRISPSGFEGNEKFSKELTPLCERAESCVEMHGNHMDIAHSSAGICFWKCDDWEFLADLSAH
jgi:hypothetical protein